eukprot:3351049-Pleurochrysis_carterae.AAC.1
MLAQRATASAATDSLRPDLYVGVWLASSQTPHQGIAINAPHALSEVQKRLAMEHQPDTRSRHTTRPSLA